MAMALICYHASHEQFAPSHLLQLVKQAEKAGFDGIHASDHFHPWSERQGESGFTFSWIGAAMQATTLPFSMVCAPGQRLHPAIVAQAAATLSEMFPGRFNMELGSGEAINETITGEGWPDKEQRNKRLWESYQVIKQLLNGEEVNMDSTIQVSHARLYTLPEQQPVLLAAAVSEETAKWAGSWADGLLTTAGSLDDVKHKIEAFRNNGGKGKPVYLQFGFSYGRNEAAAAKGAHDQWRSNIQPADRLEDWEEVKQFDEASQTTSEKEVTENIPVFTGMPALQQQLQEYLTLDIDRLILHNINRQQEIFIQDYGVAR